MPLLVYNLTGVAVVLDAGNPAPTIPASADPPNRGPAFNVTAELRPSLTVDPVNGVAGGLEAGDFALLQLQVDASDIEFAWTADPEYLTTGLTIGGASPGAHAASHISGAGDEVDGDQLDIDFTPTNYTPDTAPAEASVAAHLTAHLAGIDGALATPATHAASHISGAGDEVDGDQLDIDFTPSNYTPDTAPAEATTTAHLTAHLAGIDNALLAGASLVQEFTATVDTTDLTAAALSEAVSLAGFPAETFVIAAWVELDTEFSGGGAASVTVQVGDSGSANELMTATNIFTGAGAGRKFAAGANHGAFTYESAYAPEALVTSDVNVDTLTAGSMIVHILYLPLSLSTP